ncbi:MAG: hypothetical protein EAZ34_00755 [Polaromonas sp.]|nr:MAG: hypothetical protein EAZ34_00755 [Polaromonas sp.]
MLALAALLSACSAVKLGYNQLPALAFFYLNGYADFTEAQSLQVKSELTRLHTWHRQTQLPAYADLLDKLQTVLQGNITPAQVCAVWPDVRRQLLAVPSQAEPAVAALALSLQPEQLQHMQRKFARGNADYRKDFIDAAPAAIRARRYEQATSRADMLYGPLDEQQLRRIGQLVDQTGLNAPLVYAERLRRQQDALQTLRAISAANSTANTAAAQTQLRALLDRTLASPEPAYRSYIDKNTQDGCRAVAELHNSTTDAQRRKAMRVVRGYAVDLRTLAGQGDGA